MASKWKRKVLGSSGNQPCKPNIIQLEPFSINFQKNLHGNNSTLVITKNEIGYGGISLLIALLGIVNLSWTPWPERYFLQLPFRNTTLLIEILIEKRKLVKQKYCALEERLNEIIDQKQEQLWHFWPRRILNWWKKCFFSVAYFKSKNIGTEGFMLRSRQEFSQKLKSRQHLLNTTSVLQGSDANLSSWNVFKMYRFLFSENLKKFWPQPKLGVCH